MNWSLNLKKKTELLNSYFAKQCSILYNDSKLSHRFHYFTDKRLSIIKFSSNSIFHKIKKLDPNKAHSHNMINIRKLKIYEKSIRRALVMILNECKSNGTFLSKWKNRSAVLINKKRRAMFQKLFLSCYYQFIAQF